MEDTSVRTSVLDAIDSEIRASKKQQKIYWLLSTVLLLVVIVAGALATFLSAVKIDNNILTAALALCTTIFGTIEKNFGLAQKASGYRKVKAHFQNLKLDMLQTKPDEPVPAEVFKKIKELRLLKAELTDD